MAGNTFGRIFTITSFGESHGPAIGCVVDGCPPGLALSVEDIQHDLDRRKPGTSRHVTQRQESDTVEVLSGVFEGKTTGTPIALLIRNEDARSRDYGNLIDTFRPGHADYTYWQKYGIRDHRGGGRASARETAVRVAAAAIARKWLREKYGVVIRGYLSQLGPIDAPFKNWDEVSKNPFFSANSEVVPKLESFMDELRKAGDSVGARITTVAESVPVGWGGTCLCETRCRFSRRDDEYQCGEGCGDWIGFGSVTQRGSEHGDELTPDGFVTNHAGGILGGISTGQDIVVTIGIKPTSSIRVPRRSIDKLGQPVTVETNGRHDPCVGIRATPIAEAMMALVLMDHALLHRAQNADVMTKTPKIAGSGRSGPLFREQKKPA